MPHIRLIFTLVGLLVGVAAQAAGASPASCPNALRTNVNGSSDFARCMADWIRGVFGEAGCPLNIAYGPITSTDRSLRQIEEGSLDVILGSSLVPERQRYGRYSSPYTVQKVRLAVRSDALAQWPVTTLCDAVMQNARVYGPAQGWYGARWQAAQQGAACGRIAWFHGVPTQGPQLLLDRKVDLVLTTETTFETDYASRQPQLVLLPNVVETDPVALLFSLRTVAEADFLRIDAALKREVRRNGPPCGLPPPR